MLDEKLEYIFWDVKRTYPSSGPVYGMCRCADVLGAYGANGEKPGGANLLAPARNKVTPSGIDRPSMVSDLISTNIGNVDFKHLQWRMNRILLPLLLLTVVFYRLTWMVRSTNPN